MRKPRNNFIEHEILAMLREHPQGRTSSDLAKELGCTAYSIGHYLSNRVDRGLVTRETFNGRKTSSYSLTELGTQITAPKQAPTKFQMTRLGRKPITMATKDVPNCLKDMFEKPTPRVAGRQMPRRVIWNFVGACFGAVIYVPIIAGWVND